MRNKWAVAVQHVQNDRGYDQELLANALSAIFGAEGRAAFEMYANRQWYCSNSHDVWLESYFKSSPNGLGTSKGFEWVWDTWASVRDRLRVIMGVKDARFENPIGTQLPSGSDAPPRFMDRMFYVWKRYAYPTVIARTNGGFGTYQWDSEVSDDNRDLQFAAAWVHYVSQDQNSPRFTVPCP